MKGIIFNLLEQVIAEEYGQDVWEGLLEETGLEGAYTAVGSYEDSELLALVAAASAKTGNPEDDVVRWFGHKCLPLLAKRYPDFFTPHKTTKSFMLTLNEVIHSEVRKLFPGAYAPSFDFKEGEDTLELAYESHRNLCSFAEGLIEGAAEHFAEQVSITQSECTKRGDDRCILVTSFGSRG